MGNCADNRGRIQAKGMIDMTRANMSRRAFVAASTLLLAGCGNSRSSQSEESKAAEDEQATSSQTTAEDNPQDTAAQDNGDTQAASSSVLVVYYSRADENYADGGTEWLAEGHTKVMAGYIADALGADTYEIIPTEAYPESYDECCDVALDEQHNDVRPAIANPLPDVSAYSTVFIGCPIWWGEEPYIVRTFVEGVDLSGKTIVPFTTHGGSGLGSVPTNLQSMIAGAEFLDGKAVAGTAVDGAADEVTGWATGLALA